MLYLEQVLIYTAAMLLIYFLLLRNRTHYQFSRYYLIATAIVPVVIPLFRLPEWMGRKIQQSAVLQIDLPAVTVIASNKITGIKGAMPTIWIVYIVLALLLIIWNTVNIFRILHAVRNSKKVVCGDYTLITCSGFGPGSFGRYIFFPGADINETVLAHEQAHIRLHHTVDIILVNTIQALFWPNLFLAWIKRELKEVHEFQADACVHVSRDEYTQLLLCSFFNSQSVPVMHLFIVHPIKRRIMMLQKNSKVSPVKTAVMVCSAFTLFLGVAVGVQSCSKKTDGTTNAVKHDDGENTDPRIKQALLNPPPDAGKSQPNPDNSGIYTYAHKMPKAGYDYVSFISQNTHYPAYARKKSIYGKVIVRFIVDENGNIKDTRCMRSVDTSLDNEAIRVVGLMPPWNPGEENGKKVPVYFTLPIVFSEK